MKKTLTNPARPRAAFTAPGRRRRLVGLAALGLLGVALLSAFLAPRAKSAGGPVAVTVANSATAPAPVSAVDGPARQPYAVEAQAIIDPGFLSGYARFTVPAGKRLVIQNLNANIQTDTTTNTPTGLEMAVSTGGKIVYYNYNSTLRYSQPYTFFENEAVVAYADPSTTVDVALTVAQTVNSNGAYGNVILSGYLEPAS